jgi:hypothetical protein
MELCKVEDVGPRYNFYLQNPMEGVLTATQGSPSGFLLLNTGLPFQQG